MTCQDFILRSRACDKKKYESPFKEFKLLLGMLSLLLDVNVQQFYWKQPSGALISEKTPLSASAASAGLATDAHKRTSHISGWRVFSKYVWPVAPCIHSKQDVSNQILFTTHTNHRLQICLKCFYSLHNIWHPVLKGDRLPPKSLERGEHLQDRH